MSGSGSARNREAHNAAQRMGAGVTAFGAAPSSLKNAEVTAVDDSVAPARHTLTQLDRGGQPIEGSLILRARTADGLALEVGTKVFCAPLADGDFGIFFGSSASGANLAGFFAHSHTGGGDGPELPGVS